MLKNRAVFSPIPPSPLPSGKGETKVIFMQGATAPGTPALNRLRHLQSLPNRFPAGEGKTHGSAYNQQEGFPSEQCRQPRRGGDRGRWNYPSQATAAFEMVLSPGAGIASAAGGQGSKPKAGVAGGKEGKLPPVAAPCKKIFKSP